MAFVKNPVSLLQEMSIQRFNRNPSYIFEQVGEQDFKCEVRLDGKSKVVQCKGKKKAKMLAATAMIKEVEGSSNGSITSVCPSSSDLVEFKASNQNNEVLFTCISKSSNSTNSVVSDASSSPSSQSSINILEAPPVGLAQCPSGTSCKSSNIPKVYDLGQELNDTAVNLEHLDLQHENSSNDSDEPKKTKLSHPISVLQETLSQSNVSPNYELVNVKNGNSNNPVYYYKVSAKNKSAEGNGHSKKEAKTKAAIEYLNILGIKCENPFTDVNRDNYVGQLMTFCQENYVQNVPSYEPVERGQAHLQLFTIQCKVGNFSTDGTSKTKKCAKNLSAKSMLDLLRTTKIKELDITFQSKLNDKNVSKDIWDKLDSFSVRIAKSCSEVQNIPVCEYINLFQRGFYGKSATLNKLKSIDITCIDKLPDPGNMFRSIVNELSIEYEINSVDSKNVCLINLCMKCSPNWSFIEKGITLETAKKKVFISALTFLHDM